MKERKKERKKKKGFMMLKVNRKYIYISFI